MKTETKKRIWAEVVRQLNGGEVSGNSFQLQFDHRHKPFIRIFNSQRWTLPDEVVDQLTGPANEAIESARQKAIEKSKATADRLRKEREELDKRLDEDGFTLLAGEETDVICQGTLRECRDNLWKVLKCERDPYVGKGCYVIVDRDNTEVQSGEFDKDCVY